MSDIPSFPYADLWGERAITSVANLTRRDADDLAAVKTRLDRIERTVDGVAQDVTGLKVTG